MPKFDRAAIFRDAHEEARRMIRWSGFRGPYRKAFSIALRFTYYAMRQATEEAAYTASLPPIPPETQARIDELREGAWGCRTDGPGNAMHAALLNQVRDLTEAARGLI